MYDVAILGTGPAGISAALTLKASEKNIILFGSGQLSQKIRKAARIRNYPGLSDVTGEDFANALTEQLAQMEILITEKTITGVYDMGTYYGCLSGQEVFEAKTVILATGVESTRPIPGELEFVGRGVSYCATCDGFLYKGKTIAVICTSQALAHEVLELAELAEKVYLIAPDPAITAVHPKIERLSGWPEAITGDMRVKALAFKEQEITVDGVFLLKKAVPPSILVGGLQIENGHIAVKRDCSTNLPGCFAAGDCTGRPYQYAKAAGEGHVAAHSVLAYLRQSEGE